MSFDFLQQWNILLPALLAGFVVLSTHVPLGREVLRRGIIFLDLAVAQMAALGLVLADSLGVHSADHEYGDLLAQMVALVSAMGGAGIIYCFRGASARVQEAIIGVIFMLASTGSILLLAANPHGGEHLKEILVGQILWAEYRDLMMIGLVYIVIMTVWCRVGNNVSSYVFYPVFAVAVTLSTQLVGVYLVFASLIIPALASVNARSPIRAAYAMGAVGYVFGLLGSAWLDLPSGALIAWTLAVVGGGYYLVFGRSALAANRADA
jgi:zinc/manganese transport system permease protein